MTEYQQFSVENQNGVNVLRLRDNRIHDLEAIEELGQELKALTSQKLDQKLLFDMSVVEFVSSAVLNRLIVLDKQLKNSGGKLGFCCLRPEVMEVFSITQLNQVFPVFDDQAKGVSSMSSDD